MCCLPTQVFHQSHWIEESGENHFQNPNVIRNLKDEQFVLQYMYTRNKIFETVVSISTQYHINLNYLQNLDDFLVFRIKIHCLVIAQKLLEYHSYLAIFLLQMANYAKSTLQSIYVNILPQKLQSTDWIYMLWLTLLVCSVTSSISIK